MKVLVAHNHYQQPGGEDQAFAAETGLLEKRGHTVVRLVADNNQICSMAKFSLARATVWSSAAHREVRAVLRRERPDVMHVHNTFPLLSPAIYFAARDEGVPVVQTLHNYRLICPNALLFRDGRVCEDCVGKIAPLPGVLHACYRGSRATSAVVAAMLTAHNAIGTWGRVVDLFIVLTEFARKKFVAGGLPADRMFVKPNFVDPDPGVGPRDGEYFLFVGRLVPEKGLDTLLSAWERGNIASDAELRIIGDGPLAEYVRARAAATARVKYLGAQARDRVLAEMRGARCLVFPTMLYEGFPFVIAEAFAVGLPVIGTDRGAAASLIAPGRTGLHFAPGDPAHLRAQLRWAVDHSDAMREMGDRARLVYEAELTADRNYALLTRAYAKVGVQRAQHG